MLIALNKPYLVHCKFTDDQGRPTLAQFGLPPRVYVAGRLDHDSEGLLLLTDDGKLNQRLTDPRWKAPKTYCVQVEGTATESALARLREGVELNDGMTLPAEAKEIAAPVWLWQRDPPIRVRKTVPDCWLELAVGLPTLRLIRSTIGPYGLEGLVPGAWKQIEVRGTH
jgi:23S rRNA pseudouridine2457 synthase